MIEHIAHFHRIEYLGPVGGNFKRLHGHCFARDYYFNVGRRNQLTQFNAKVHKYCFIFRVLGRNIEILPGIGQIIHHLGRQNLPHRGYCHGEILAKCRYGAAKG